MLRKILLPVIFVILAWGFWISPDLKVVAAGVSIFLFGMLSLEDGFKAFTGGTLEKILKKSTNKLWKSLSFGILSTTIMQSSSLVSVITISFLSAGLLGLYEGVGIIFGANLGTTTGAWLVAGFGLKVDISAYAMPMLVFGVLLVFQRSNTLKGFGYILTGLGFLFLGIHYMKEGFEAFKGNFDLAQFAVSGYSGIFLFSALGVLATVVMQSSHATLVLTITALASGQISYENALALSIGANVGTTITAIIGSMSANEQGKRLAGAHLIFNLVTGFIAIVFIYQMMSTVDWISEEVGIAADDHTLKLAVFHTLFNLLGVLIMLPFIRYLVTFLEGLFKEKQVSRTKPKYLTDSAISFPDTATEAVRNETLRVWDNAINIFSGTFGFKRSDVLSNSDLDHIANTQKKISPYDIDTAYTLNIKSLYSEIVSFISKAGFSWEMEQSGEIHWLRKANQNITDAVKDTKHLQKNLSVYGMSSNPKMKEAYTLIRVELCLLIRELESINLENEGEGEKTLFSLDHLRLLLDEHISNMNTWLSQSIRKNLITAEMATSLMNDVTYAANIYRNLIQMGETLFIKRNHDLSNAERTLILDDEELDAINDDIKEQAENNENTKRSLS
ncbi:Na/Pi cotransporter family protein [sulfur-oxidizing endosymbiont of Gigantopelta aegis]|uniref:Na/Pi cotransporter family protein n=1 Tax=sulfur-oxidizing endosymbiont of Gigantopelta aegis TaxID=2794934 RepID=UPI0018DE7E96|nr:Na/Pi symporter [sulfur-oxidizing endosymbiont of Gigantopelta aegis]